MDNTKLICRIITMWAILILIGITGVGIILHRGTVKRLDRIEKSQQEILKEVERIPRWCHDVEGGLWRMVKTEEVMCKQEDYHKDVRRSLQ